MSTRAVLAVSGSIVSFGLIVAAALVTGDAPQAVLSLLIAALGMGLGWFAGILATPRDGAQARQFQQISHLAWVFLSGYLVSKLDRGIDRLFAPEQVAQPIVMTRIVGFTVAFVTTAIIAYSTRNSIGEAIALPVEQHSPQPEA